LFSVADEDCIPDDLRRYSHYFVEQDDSYADLLAWLRGTASEPAADGTIAWPEPRPEFQWPLADRRPQFDWLNEALTGHSTHRTLLLQAPSGRGKTVLFGAIQAYARRLGVAVALLDFKGCPSVAELFETLILDLDDGLLPQTRRASANERPFRVIADLQALKRPLLLLLDTYEQASDDSRRWLETQLLPRLDRAPGLVVLIAGHKTPDPGGTVWAPLAEHCELSPIDSVQDWVDYSRRQWPDVTLPRHEIALLAGTAFGNPSLVGTLLTNLATLKRQKVTEGAQP
jgi:hypothetical protein